jgi:hypothetical protein
MRIKLAENSKGALALLGIALLLGGTYAWAQNLGAAPATNVAVQGQTGARSRPFETVWPRRARGGAQGKLRPEGGFLNMITGSATSSRPSGRAGPSWAPSPPG